MKSLLKLSFFCMLTFFTTNMIQAQCANLLSMTEEVVSEDETSVSMRFTVTTDIPADKIYISGASLCYDTSKCVRTVRFTKSCSGSVPTRVDCKSLANNCTRREGCVVVVGPRFCGSGTNQ